MRPPSAYAGYTLRPDQRGEPQRPADPRFDSRPAEPRQERYAPSPEGYGQSFSGEPRRGETQRPTWEQAQREAAPTSYPAYPGPGQTQRYAPQQQAQYYPQNTQTYNPARDGRQGLSGAAEPTARYTDPESGYTPPAPAYESNDYYRQGANDYQPNTYQPQPQSFDRGQTQSFERSPATQRSSTVWDSGPAEPQQSSSTTRRGSTQRFPTPEPQPPAPESGYFPSDHEEEGDQGLMGSAEDATLQRFAPQPPQYAPQNDAEPDNRAGNYPIARTQQDDDLDADFFTDDEDFDAEEETGGRGGRRKLVAAVLVGAMVVGGGGYYMLKHRQAGGDGSEPPTFAQDGRAVKDAPANPGGKRFANGSKAIYDRLGMGDAAGGQDGAAQQAGVVGGGGSVEDRFAQARGGGQQTSASGQIGESPRPVSTFRVYPDGRTEEPQRTAAVENASAGGEGDAGARPAVMMQRSVNDAGASAAPAQGEGEAAPAPAPTPTPAAPAKGRAAKGGTKVQQIAAVESTPAATPAVAAAPSGSSWYAQVGARNDQNQALAAVKVVQDKYGSVLGNYAPVIHKADLGAKGTWYRVRVGPIEDKEAASGLCEKLKGAGQKDCMVVKE